MYAEERQQAIAEVVAREGRAGVAALAERFAVTPETIRRDLDRLEEDGLLRRVHGGAVPAGALAVLETGLGDRELVHAEEKRRIGRAAADLLPPAGGAVTIDAGSTTAALVDHLPDGRSLTVFTNAVPIAARLTGRPGVELHLVGGRVRGITHAAVGPAATSALAEVRTDVAFIGTNGLTPTFGASTHDEDEAATKRALAATGRQVVVVADASKLGVEHRHRFLAPAAIDVLVTDEGAPDDVVGQLEATGVKVVTT